ncbi:MAG: GtrA family protein [Betaproteobacteria bacterium]
MALAKYTLVGGIATAAHYLSLLVLVEVFGVAAALAAFWGAIVGAGLAYWGNRRITFGASSASHGTAAPRFALVALVGALINGAIVWAGVHTLGVHYLLAQAAATLAVLLLTYHLNRTWTFA